MYLIVSKVLVVFEGAVELEDENVQPVMLVEGDTELSTTEGAVASASGDSTVTDEAILRGADVVVHVPQSSEPDTTLVVEEGETSQVVADSSNSPNSGPSETYRRVSFGCLNSLLGATDCTNHTCYFSLDLVCTDFEPYTGDCVEVIFSTDPDTQSRRAVSVKPRVYKHVSEVCITSIHGRNGVIDDAIFFTLDSLKLPEGYVPQIYHVVNAVVVESFHSGYVWRAISITPVLMM